MHGVKYDLSEKLVLILFDFTHHSRSSYVGFVCSSMSLSSFVYPFFHMQVPFEEVPELVAGRKVFINQGYAYVAMNQVDYCSCFFVFCLNCCLFILSLGLLQMVAVNLSDISSASFTDCFFGGHTIPQSTIQGTHTHKQVFLRINLNILFLDVLFKLIIVCVFLCAI